MKGSHEPRSRIYHVANFASQQLMKATDTSWSQCSSAVRGEERFCPSIKRRDQGEFNVKVFSSSTRISCKLARNFLEPEFQTEFSMTRRFLPFQSSSRKITNYRSLSVTTYIPKQQDGRFTFQKFSIVLFPFVSVSFLIHLLFPLSYISSIFQIYIRFYLVAGLF